MTISNTNIGFGNATSDYSTVGSIEDTFSPQQITRSRINTSTNTVSYSPPQSRRQSLSVQKLDQPLYAASKSESISGSSLLPFEPSAPQQRGLVRQVGLVRQKGSRNLLTRRRRRIARRRRSTRRRRI